MHMLLIFIFVDMIQSNAFSVQDVSDQSSCIMSSMTIILERAVL